MYYATKTQTSNSRVVAIVAVVALNVAVGAGLAMGMGKAIVNTIVKTEVAIVPEELPDDEPPPPPPPDIDLPPPPPQVVLPEFTFDVPPPPNAIQQVTAVERPVNAPPAPRPPPAPPAPPAQVVTSWPTKTRRFEPPPYPPAAERAKEEGTTGMQACVDANGRITDIKLVRSSGSTRLDDAALKHMRGERWEPAKDQNGKAMATCGWPIDWVWQLPK